MKTIIYVVVAMSLLMAGALAQDAEESEAMRQVRNAAGDIPEPQVAIENVCAWPNLTVLPDGTIIATIFNQPNHLGEPGDVDCWASEDNGLTWELRGTPAPRDTPEVARGNVAVGLAENGDLIVVTSGWAFRVTEDGRNQVLPPMVSRSSDGGRSWERNIVTFPATFPDGTVAVGCWSSEGYLVPFGDILPGEDGHLRVGMYGDNPGATFLYTSRDHGVTWEEPVQINADVVIHEPAFFHLGKGRWLCAARLNGLDLYVSEDDGKSWRHEGELSGREQHPGHIMRLADGRLLLSYGNRNDNPKGVDVRVSGDEGATWSEPWRVMNWTGDGGYPSTVQLPDGNLLTAYYAQQIEGYANYHMGVVIWTPDSLTE